MHHAAIGRGLRTTFLKSSTVWRRERAVTVASSRWPCGAGRAPISPAGTCVFCAVSAAVTSEGIRLTAASLAGSSQMRMA
jgi:hypothetical protein